jgi:hypothetical protein
MNTQNRNTLYRLLSEKDSVAIGYQKLSVTGTAQALTIPDGATYAELRLESDVTASIPVRYLMLGNNTLPTATDGMALNHLDFFDIDNGTNMMNFRVIRTVAGTHTLHVQYYK